MNDERVKTKIVEVVASLANYNLDVWSKVGPTVQMMLIDALRGLSPGERVGDREIVITVCRTVLEPEIEGTTWHADSVSLRTGAVPAIPQIATIRDQAISILFDLFKSAKNDAERREILHTLRQAGYSGGRVETSDDLLRLTLSDSTRIVEFFFSETGSLSYELMETLEHEYLWEYRRTRGIVQSQSRENSKEAASRLMDAIERLREKFNSDERFVQFKTLVGYESVFAQQWESDSDDFSALEKYRDEKAASYVKSINEQNESKWFEFIERIASVESNDLATFPAFTRFLTELARAKPRTAAALLNQASEQVMGFLPAILAGLSASSEQNYYDEQVERVLKNGKHLAALVRHLRHALRFEKSASPNLAKRVLQRAIEVQDDIAVMECLVLGMEYPVEKSPSKGEFFEPAINYLNRKKEFRWVRAAWLANESKSFFATLSRDQASLLMPAMIAIPKIDFQAEQVLIPIAKLYPDLIWECFAGRLATKRDEEDRFENRYEAIPYQLHGLEMELSKNAKLAVEFGRNLFAANSELFRFRGGRLLKSAFPSCPPNFADELASLAENGTYEDAKFILAILENYHGEQSTHEILKRIVARYPDDEKIRTSVIISLEGTGVVWGEFGFVDALRGKVQIARQWQNDPRAEVRTFGEAHARSLEVRIADEQRRAQERKALRELEYEVPSDNEGNSDD